MASPIPTVIAWAHRRRTVVLGLVAAALIASMAGASRLSFDTDVLSLLPRDSPVVQSFSRFLARFGSLDQLYVVFTAADGHAISEYDDDINLWIEQLRASPEIARVDTGSVDRTRDFGWLADHQLLMLQGRSLDEALDRLGPGGMGRAVAARRELLATPSPDIAGLIRQDPAGLFDVLRDAIGAAGGGLTIGVSASGYVTADGHSRLIIAHPKRPPFDSEFSRALDARLRVIQGSIQSGQRPKTDIDDEALPPLGVTFAGGYRIAVETEAFVKRESVMNTVGSLAMILPLLLIVFRSLWLVAVGSLPSALSLVMTLGILGFAGARLSAAATGAAAMLFGLGVDGVVLMYVAYRSALAENRSDDVPSAIAGPSASMLLGMWTTAATFYGLVFVDFPSLQQLGLLIGHSMVLCGILTLVMVPALLPRRAPTRTPRPLLMPRMARWIEHRRLEILIGAVVCTVVLGGFASRIRINPTLDRLRSTTAAADMETKIGRMFGLPDDVYVVLAEGSELEPLLEANEKLAGRLHAEVADLSFAPPSRLLPSAAEQARTVDRIARAGLSPSVVRDTLEQTRIANGFTPGAFDPFAARLASLLDGQARLTYDGYVSHGLQDVIDRFIVRDRDRWTLATYVFPASSSQASQLEGIVASVDPGQMLTGLTVVNRELSRRFLPQFLKGLLIGTIIVVVLVVLAFRDLRLSFYALVPTAIGLVWTAGALAIGHVELDLFAVFAVVTFVGIGVDYGVHLVHRYQERGDAISATAELAPVILIAGTITLFGYGTLVTSSYPPLRSIGIVSTVSVVALAAASMLVLPALLLESPDKTPRDRCA